MRSKTEQWGKDLHIEVWKDIFGKQNMVTFTNINSFSVHKHYWRKIDADVTNVKTIIVIDSNDFTPKNSHGWGSSYGLNADMSPAELKKLKNTVCGGYGLRIHCLTANEIRKLLKDTKHIHNGGVTLVTEDNKTPKELQYKYDSFEAFSKIYDMLAKMSDEKFKSMNQLEYNKFWVNGIEFEYTVKKDEDRSRIIRTNNRTFFFFDNNDICTTCYFEPVTYG